MVNRELRLREERDIREARSKGKAFADGAIVARIFPNGSDPARNRYAFITGKKIGKAHERNRCKRLVREAARLHHPDIVHGYDVVFILRGGEAELIGLDVAMESLSRIYARAGIKKPDVEPERSVAS